jgi:hypothetical protein
MARTTYRHRRRAGPHHVQEGIGADDGPEQLGPLVRNRPHQQPPVAAPARIDEMVDTVSFLLWQVGRARE